MTTPGYGGTGQSMPGKESAGRTGGEPTNQPGQYPGSLFGVGLPQGTGAPGSPGASGMADPTNQPGQLNEGLSGLGPSAIADTGAPGSQGNTNSGGGPDHVTYTEAGSYLDGTYDQEMISDNVSGTDDWTQANDGSYGGGGQQLPGIAGNTPTSTGAGQGTVRRGGRGA